MDDLPRGHFRCILADPPWAFRTFSGETMTPHRCAEDHYPTMTLAELQARVAADVRSSQLDLPL